MEACCDPPSAYESVLILVVAILLAPKGLPESGRLRRWPFNRCAEACGVVATTTPVLDTWLDREGDFDLG
jgi:hypothetical protein